MKNGELVELNMIFNQKLKLPAMTGEQLYAVLSAKADIQEAAEAVENKAEKFRLDTKPEGIDEYNAKMSDPSVREWWNRFVSMRTRLYEEEFKGTMPDPCIPKDLFPDMVAGMTPGEAMVVMKHLVKS